MTAHIATVAFEGIEVRQVDVQVQLSSGLPAFTIVGLPDKAVAESRERVRAALGAMGLAMPPDRITVNLAPADLLKEGSHFDLPIALGLAAAMGVIPGEALEDWVALGELALDGGCTPVSGVLPAALGAAERGKGIICAAGNGGEAAWAGAEVPILAAPNLLAAINDLAGRQSLPRPEPAPVEDLAEIADLREVKGQESAKRALEGAAAGAHNLLMTGPPGSGKSMLAARLPGLLPPLDPAEALQVSMIHSVAGLLQDGRLRRRRPFREPHHSASMAALIGGGPRARPGEISLAHHGVLFLDELPEFARPALEALRQPLETGRAVIARALRHVTYPARVQLVAAMNPCPCGHLDDTQRACRRAPRCGDSYRERLSGPLLDRIDLHVEVPRVMAADLGLPASGETSEEVAARVREVRALQAERYRGTPGLRTNAEADGAVLERVAKPDRDGHALLARAAERLHLSARAWHRTLRVARTLADLAGSDGVRRIHVAEALSYRSSG